MKTNYAILMAIGATIIQINLLGAQSALINTNIDMIGYLKIAQEAAVYRESHRVTESEFIRLSKETEAIVLDARSREMFSLLHIKGAINLSFPDISVESLARMLPDKGQRILIYCNNNFQNSPRAFQLKSPNASLNLSTYVALYSYGYTNVCELGPLLDVKTTKIEFEPKSEESILPNATNK